MHVRRAAVRRVLWSGGDLAFLADAAAGTEGAWHHEPGRGRHDAQSGGWGLAAYLYENLSVPQIVAIAELQPPRLPAYRAFFAYLVLTAVVLVMQPRRLTLSEEPPRPFSARSA